MSVESAGATLDSCARFGMAETAFLEADREYVHHINTLAYFTKSAIIISSLRSLNSSFPDSSRISKILQEFERLTFLSLPPEGKTAVTELFTKLIHHIRKAKEIAEDQTLTSKEASSKKLLWSKEWLSSVSDDEGFLKRMALVYGLPLFSYLHGSIQLLGNSVDAVVLGKEIE